MNKSGAGGNLPSGMQVEDLMQELHEHLWRETKSGAAKKMSRAEFDFRSAKGERLEVMKDEEHSTPTNVGEDPGSEDSLAQETGEDGKEADLTDHTSSANDPSEATGDRSDTQPQTGSNPPGEDKAEGVLTVRTRTPDNWLHRHSLVICFFSRISDSPDPDLDIQPCNGPPCKKARVSDASECDTNNGGEIDCGEASDCGSGRLSRRSVNLLGKINEPHSRKDAKEAKVQAAKGFRMETFFTTITDRLVASMDEMRDESQKDVLAEGMQAMANAVKESAGASRVDFDEREKEIKLRTRKAEWLKYRMRTYEEMGLATEVEETKAELLNFLGEPLNFDMPLGPKDVLSATGINSNADNDCRIAGESGNNVTRSG